jgi:hypothetical protein
MRVAALYEPVLVSYGAGTNSTAMLIEMVARGERIDAILFADTGGERPETYAFLALFSAWLSDQGYPAITVVRHLLRDGTFQSLEDECLSKAILPSIAYGFKKCAGKFKLEPQTKWTNAWPAARSAWIRRARVIKLIGFGVDERGRAEKGNAYQDDAWYRRYVDGESIPNIARSEVAEPGDRNQLRNLSRRITEACRYRKRYPLIEFGMGRDECVETIARAGLPPPGKSACFFCSSSKLHEIRALTIPLRNRAIALEDTARPGLTAIKGLGRSFAWRDVLEDRQTALPFPPSTELPCECSDGDDDQLELALGAG